jgi:hypothetical protein
MMSVGGKRRQRALGLPPGGRQPGGGAAARMTPEGGDLLLLRWLMLCPSHPAGLAYLEDAAAAYALLACLLLRCLQTGEGAVARAGEGAPAAVTLWRAQAPAQPLAAAASTAAAVAAAATAGGG